MQMPALASRGRARPRVLGHKVRIRRRDWGLEVGLGWRQGQSPGPRSPPVYFRLSPSLCPWGGAVEGWEQRH